MIRAFRIQDRAALIALWQSAGLTVWYNDPGADIDRYLESPGAAIFVADQGDELVGSVCVGGDGHRAYVYYVAVAPAQQGKGLGRALMAAAEDWAREHKLPKLQFMIRPSNLKVRAFYQALGYHETPRALMAKWLEDPAQHAAPPRFDLVESHLEMRSNPAWQALAPSHLRLALLQATTMDPAFYAYLQEQVGAPQAWRDRRGLPLDQLRAFVEDPKNEIFVLNVNGCPAGFFELACHDPSAIKLVFFGLTPAWQAQGLGRYLMRAALDQAWSHKPDVVKVTTDNLDHPRALAFYQRAGFEIAQQMTRNIVDPRAPMP